MDQLHVYKAWAEQDPKVAAPEALKDITIQYDYPEFAQALWALWKQVSVVTRADSLPWKTWLKPHPPASRPSDEKLQLCESEALMAARVYRWAYYLERFRPRLVTSPSDSVLQRAHAMRLKLTAFVRQPQLDPFYNLGKEYVKSSYMMLGGEAWFMQHHPREKGFTNVTDYLREDLDAATTIELNEQLRMHPVQQWDTMRPNTQTMWLMAAFAYQFDQATCRTPFPMRWQEYFWVPWWELCTKPADERLRCTRQMEQTARPVVVMYGVNDWTINQRIEGEAGITISTTDMTEAIAQWIYWVYADFEGLLANDSPVPCPFYE